MRRLLRLAWLTAAVAVAAVAGVAVAAGNAPSAPAAPAANPTFTLVQITKADCPAPKVILGKACWDKSGQILSANWSVNDGNATWDTTGWTTTYKWTPPATIGPTGAAIKLDLTALSKSGVVCPAMGAHASFPLKDPKQDPVLGVCAKPNEGTAIASKTVNVVATSSGPGSITIGLQDGPQITYKYIAAEPDETCGSARSGLRTTRARGQPTKRFGPISVYGHVPGLKVVHRGGRWVISGIKVARLHDAWTLDDCGGLGEISRVRTVNVIAGGRPVATVGDEVFAPATAKGCPSDPLPAGGRIRTGDPRIAINGRPVAVPGSLIKADPVVCGSNLGHVK